MYQCPGCGSELRFDIKTQALECNHCSQYYDPYDITKAQDAEESEEFDATVFKCPQCGGEILSKDNTAADFCSFCGASVILSTRMTKIKRPKYIIPFKKTKEDCKKAYSKMMRKAIFAPKELKDKKFIDGFRGIYTPYWAYHVTQQGSFDLRGEKSHRRGDYIYTDHYSLKGRIDSGYKGISHDASSSFDDETSERIAPYDVEDMKNFTPSFLTGFYADTADVPDYVYQNDVKELADSESIKYIKSLPGVSGYGFGNKSSSLNSRVAEVDSTMYPVWFLSYRNKDRVAYATVNGQTGKVAADLPVSIGKYFFGSMLLAVPIFILLNLFFTFTPKVALMIVTAISIFANILYSIELNQIIKKDQNVHDKGAQAVQNKRGLKFKSSSNKTKKKALDAAGVIVGTVFGMWGIMLLIIIAGEMGAFGMGVVFVIASVITGIIAVNKFSKMEKKTKLPAFVFATLGALIASAVLIINPVSDVIYYGAAIIATIAVFIALVDLIRYYNVLATRKLPQFTYYKGGDDRA